MSRDERERTIDPAAKQMLARAAQLRVPTAWDRFEAVHDTCGFGTLGLCCRNCMIGPCRIDPFGEGPRKGVCGISAEGIVARNLCRMIASGTAAHSDHAAHLLEVVEKLAQGHPSSFQVKNERKLRELATILELPEEDEPSESVLARVASAVRSAFSCDGQSSQWTAKTMSGPRLARLARLGLLPSGVDPVIRETMHRTHMGVDADATNLILGALRCAMADFLGMDIASRLADILFGTPKIAFSASNLGVLRKDAVNVAVHGHNPLISESILRVLPEYQERARHLGAAGGINIVGVCCTGHEVLLRHGIPLCTNAASQELAILTGAVDLMVVDVQCVMPSLVDVCECFHTKVVTTMRIAKIPGALHVEFDVDHAEDSARKILELALETYPRRRHDQVSIPDFKQETLVGFSPDGVLEILSKLAPADPLQWLVDRIASGGVYGVALLAGCNNYRVTQDASIVTIAERLLKDNVLVVATGCAAGALAKRGLCSPNATTQVCGEPLAAVLTTLGRAAGLNRPLPPVWHMGSCVDNSRVARLCFALADKLAIDLDRLPVVASAPEAMSEKSLAIGSWSVTLGITTHIGVMPPVGGAKMVVNLLTEEAQALLGSRLVIEPDPQMAHALLMDVLTAKRVALGLSRKGE
jgi:anaerobic carbon-monoxide dehydrogenase catalytic subunit